MGQLYSGGSLGNLIVQACRRWRDRPALKAPGVCYSYTELGDAIARALAVFAEAGLVRGQGLAIMAPNLAETAIVNAAAMVAGLRVTPVSMLTSDEDLHFILQDSAVDAILLNGERLTRVSPVLSALPQKLCVFTVGACAGDRDVAALMRAARPARLRNHAHSDDIAVIAYTGGTTGRPKGVVHTHRSTLATVMMATSEWEWPSSLNVLAVTPVSHAAGILCYPAWLRGGAFHLLPTFDPIAMARYIREEGVTTTFLVPTMIYRLIDEARTQGLNIEPLQTIIYGGAPIHVPKLIEAIEAFGPIFMQLYGQTEAPTCIAYLARSQHDVMRPDRLASCGMPLAGLDVALLDAQGEVVPDGDAGEIAVRGPLVMQGYWRRPEETADALRDGWLHTGDIGRFDADGFLTIIDRSKDMIISGGMNIFPSDIERVIAAMEGVAACAVVGIADLRWGEAVTAAVVREGPASPSAEAVTAEVRLRRGPAAAPKHVIFVDALPLTPIGKVDKKALRLSLVRV